MKNIRFVLIISTIFLIIVIGCTKSVTQPSGASASNTPTPNATLTVEAIQTAGPAAQATATAQAAATIAYANFYATATAIVKITSTAIALQTAGPNAQATATAQAVATENMQHFEATQTAIVGATQTMVAATAVVSTQTAIVAATQTAVAAAKTQTAVVATQTAAAIAATQTVVVAATQTVVVAATQTAVVAATQTAIVAATQTAVVAATQTAIVVATQTAIVVATQTAVEALVSVPGGTFTQTDATGINSFQHTISAFKMGKYEVMYDLWYTVYQWAVNNGYNFQSAGKVWYNTVLITGAVPAEAKYEPVNFVSWRDIIVWCNAYSEMRSLTPCYTYLGVIIKDSRDTNATACDNAVCTWSNNGFRLPTEGEWQYAASYIDGSSWTPYNFASGAAAEYTDAAATGLVAWYGTGISIGTHIVGGKNPNVLGIYDMSGNLFEWCWDWYGTYPGTSTNYRGSASGSLRVIRGGSYDYGASYQQVGARNNDGPYGAYYGHGFRFARSN